jgi:hypothetical protein
MSNWICRVKVDKRVIDCNKVARSFELKYSLVVREAKEGRGDGYAMQYKKE